MSLVMRKLPVVLQNCIKVRNKILPLSEQCKRSQMSCKKSFCCKICLFVKLFVILQPKIIVNNGG